MRVWTVFFNVTSSKYPAVKVHFEPAKARDNVKLKSKGLKESPSWTPSDEGIEYGPKTRLLGDWFEDRTYCRISGMYFETDSKIQSLRTVLNTFWKSSLTMA